MWKSSHLYADTRKTLARGQSRLWTTAARNLNGQDCEPEYHPAHSAQSDALANVYAISIRIFEDKGPQAVFLVLEAFYDP